MAVSISLVQETTEQDLSMTRGKTAVWNCAVTAGGVAVDLTDVALYFTGKSLLSDTDASAIFQKIIGDGITVTDAEAGEFQLKLEPADTEDLEVASLGQTQIHYDIQSIDSGDAFQLARGKITLYADVTNLDPGD